MSLAQAVPALQQRHQVTPGPYDRCTCGHTAIAHQSLFRYGCAAILPRAWEEEERSCGCQAFDAALPKAHAEIQAACQRLLEQVQEFATVLRDAIAEPSRAPELLNDEYGPWQSGLGRYGVLEHGGQHSLDWALARLEEAQPEDSEVQP